MAWGKIQLDRLLYTHYTHPSLSSIQRFCADFGLIEVAEQDGLTYFRGFGEDPYIYVAQQSPDATKSFSGAGWVVQTYSDLERAATLPSASLIQRSTAPGGGSFVDISDPNGINIRLIHGISNRKIAADEQPAPVITNTWLEKPRRGEFQRFKRGPSRIHKLGHYGILVDQTNFDSTLEWYQSIFSLATTDAVYDPKTGADMMTFCHIDKGAEFTDHHSIFICSPPSKMTGSRVHHSSFEVDDVETQTIGHYHLEKQGWTNCWGIGRHVFGSQIFDYWFDCSGNIVEHYTDGDLVNCHSKPAREPAVPETMAAWGPNVSLAFLNGAADNQTDSSDR